MWLFLMTLGVSAHDFTVGELVVDHPWSRPTPPTASIGVGYVTIVNNGMKADRLVGGSAEAADGFEIHTSQQENGIVRMRRLKDGVVIEPGATVELKPLGTHIMLTGLKSAIKADEPFAGTLVFERAGTLDVTFTVQGPGAPTSAGDGHEGHTP